MKDTLSETFESLFGKMENFVTTKTVVGDPIHIGDVIIVPLVDVMFGLGAGAGSGTNKKVTTPQAEGGGGGGIGAKITPSSVLVVVNGQAQLLNARSQDSISKLIDMVPSVLSKLNFPSVSSSSKDTKSSKHSDTKS